MHYLKTICKKEGCTHMWKSNHAPFLSPRCQKSSSLGPRPPLTLRNCVMAIVQQLSGEPSYFSCWQKCRLWTPCTSTPWPPTWRSSSCPWKNPCQILFCRNDWGTSWTPLHTTSTTMGVQVCCLAFLSTTVADRTALAQFDRQSCVVELQIVAGTRQSDESEVETYERLCCSGGRGVLLCQRTSLSLSDHFLLLPSCCWMIEWASVGSNEQHTSELGHEWFESCMHALCV